jgi:hypothetical protein
VMAQPDVLRLNVDGPSPRLDELHPE